MARNLSTIIMLLILSLSTLLAMSGVMEITLNNLKNVLATYQSVHVLFHNPQCTHSRKYVQQFLKVASSSQQQQVKLGIVDCIRQLQLCQQYNLTVFPVLAKFNSHDHKDALFELIDEQQFLIDYNIKTFEDDEAMANNFVGYLTSQPHYAVVVFEDHGLPVIQSQRITSQSPIFYLQPFDKQQNPSEFTKLISSFVNNRHGCWIFKKLNNDQLEKFACDSGYSKNITLKYIKLFTQGKLKKHISQEETKDRVQSDSGSSVFVNINSEQMAKILTHQTQNNIDPCALIYISSKHCISCSSKDTKNIQTAFKLLNLQNQLQLFKFDIDKNEIPSSLTKIGLRRVPELLYLCKKKVNIFGEVMFIDNILRFIEEQQNPVQSTEAKTKITQQF